MRQCNAVNLGILRLGLLLFRLRWFRFPVIDRTEVEKLRGVALHVENFGLHAFPFYFLPIEHTAFKVLILLGVCPPDSAPAVEPFNSFEVLNLAVLMEEHDAECDENDRVYYEHDFEGI